MEDAPNPTPDPNQALLREVLQFLEGIADSVAAIETRQEKLEGAVDDVKADTEELLVNLENISFKVDYPGLDQ